MVTITINGKKINAEKGTTVLQAARANGFDIPSLCWNDAVKAYGACRLCIVEITRDGRTFIDTSCSYPVEDGIAVKTDTPIINESRKMVIELYMARCPNVKVIKDLAAKYGVKQTPKEYAIQDEGCTLCGLCVRACNDVVGAGAIQFKGKNSDKAMASPFEKKAEDCIACGSCVYICPCNFVEKSDVLAPAPMRAIKNWKVELKLKECKICGNPYIPEAHLEKIRKEKKLPKEFFTICPSCREYPKVDQEKCKGCGSCIDCCPCGALELQDKGGADKRSFIFTQNCTACHTCEDKCTMQAIK